MDAGLLIAVGSALLIALLAGHLLARAGFPVPEARKRIGCVDGLRGYLALLVMMHHCDLWIAQTQFGQPWGASSSLLFHNFGPAGVALFFMTTGLVFYPRIRRGFQGVDWRATYLSRVFRILPLQLVLIAAVSGLSIYLGDPFNRGTVRQNLSALAGWLTTHGEPPLFGYDNAGAINAFVLWSLWYEWIFYLFVLPVLSLLRGVLGDRLPPFAIPVGCLLVGLTIGSITPPVILFFLRLFACGMIAFELRELPSAVRWLKTRLCALIAFALLALSTICLRDPYNLPQLAAFALFFSCIAAGNSFGGFFALNGSIVLGEISFGLYMLHGLVLFLLFTFAIPTGAPITLAYAAVPLATLVAVIVSAGAYLLIERPGIALGKRLAGGRHRALTARVEQPALDIAP